MGAGTIVQKALGVVDTPDLLYKYLVACGEGWTDQALLRVIADNAGKNIDWIIQDLKGKPLSAWRLTPQTPGLTQRDSANERFGITPVIRGHGFDPNPADLDKDGLLKNSSLPSGGTGIFKTFDDNIKARKIETMMQTSLSELMATSEREVLGIKALSGGKTLYIKAKKGVVLASGSFRNNVEMVRNFVPFTVTSPPTVPKPTEALGGSLPGQAMGEAVIAAHAIGAGLTLMSIVASHNTGGLVINAKAQVIDVFGKVIPRLYAAPFVAGGTHPYVSVGGGHHVAYALCFGRIAGKNAAIEKS